MKSFVMHQISQIRGGGYDVIKRKTGSLLIKIISIPKYLILFLLVLFVRLLRPLITIRLNRLDAGRIGGMVDADWYLCEKACGLHGKAYYDLFLLVQSTNHRNHFWIKIWKRSGLRIIDFGKYGHLVNSIMHINSIIPGGLRHEIPYDEHSWPPINNTLQAILKSNKTSFLTFTKEEETLGLKVATELGIPKGASFISFHNRDSAFLNAVDRIRDWSYHDYRDSHIENYIPGAEELTRRGYYAIRLGNIVEKKLSETNSKIIDYSQSLHQSDFIDIYLLANATFSIFSETGLNHASWVFRKPCLFVNWVLLKSIFYWQTGIFIPKKIYSKSEKRFLGFKEIIDQIGVCGDGRIFEQNGWEPIENTTEEITDACIEIDMRIKGQWEETEEDVILQNRFWSKYDNDLKKNPEFRIGTQFLRDNKELLEY